MNQPRCGFAASAFVQLVLSALVAASLWLSLGASLARAQHDPARAASARALFQEGVQLAERGRWADAEDRFRRALSLRASAVLTYNLASALVEQNELVEASELLRRVQSDERAPADLRQAADALQRKASAGIGRAVISVHGQQPDDRIQLDGHELLPAQLGVEIPIDPGGHQLRVERGGRTVDMKAFEVQAGQRRAVTLSAVELVPTSEQLAGDPSSAGGSSALLPQPAEPAARDSSLFASPWFWAGAAVVVALGTTLAVVAATSGKAEQPAPFHGNVPPGSLAIQVQQP